MNCGTCMDNSFVVHQKVVGQKSFLGNVCALPKTSPGQRAVFRSLHREAWPFLSCHREISGAWGYRAHGRKAAQPKAFQAKERLHFLHTHHTPAPAPPPSEKTRERSRVLSLAKNGYKYFHHITFIMAAYGARPLALNPKP